MATFTHKMSKQYMHLQAGVEVANGVWDKCDDDGLCAMILCIPLKCRGNISKTCRRGRRLVDQCIGIDLMLVDEQVNTFLDVMRGKNVFITGGAGVGKSHVLKAIINYLPQKGLLVTASTGCAAATIGATTFHSALSLGFGTAPAKTIAKMICDNNPWVYQKMKQLKTIIIDEAGMLTGKLFDKAGLVVGGVRQDCGCTHGSMISNAEFICPWSDVQVVLVGDFLQLPPVCVDQQGWLWNSSSWKSLNFITHKLTHVHRQQDMSFIRILQRMRKGEGTSDDLCHLLHNSADVPQTGSLKLFGTNAPAIDYNANMLRNIKGVFHIFHAIDSASDQIMINGELDRVLKNCPAPERLTLTVGARVMCLRNIHSQLVNGSLGTVTDIKLCYDEHGSVHHVNITVEFDGQLGQDSFKHCFQTHCRGEVPSAENHFVVTGQDQRNLAHRIQIPLRLA